MKIKEKLFYLLCFLLIIVSAGCSNNDNGIEMIDYYGTSVPYTPIEETDLPEWLRELKSEKKMFALWRICVGTLNDEIVWHLNLGTDSSLGGLFYDKDGNFISFGNEDLITQIRYVRCIYYKRFSYTSNNYIPTEQ